MDTDESPEQTGGEEPGEHVPKEAEGAGQDEQDVEDLVEEGEEDEPGTSASGREKRQKYDDSKFLEQREAMKAASLPGRERLRELAKGAPDKPPRPSPTKKPSIKVMLYLLNVTSFFF